MKKRHKQLLRKILKEEIGSTQSYAGHEWTVENPHEVFGRLPEAQQDKVRELYHSGRLHPELLHPHGWRPGTGPVFGRDFHGRSAEDYRRLHGQVRDNLIQNLGRSREQAHADATAHVEQLRARAEEEGQGTHAMHMREINISRREAAQREQERRKADTNTRGAAAQESYRRDSESLFHSAMKGASDSAHYFRTGGEAERAEEQRRGMINIDVRHPQLSDAARRHLGTLTDISRRAMHSTVIGGLNAARPAFREDAKQHWRRTFPTGMGTPPGVRGEHDILHSLLTPQAIESTLKRYSEAQGSPAQFTAPIGGRIDRQPPHYPIGSPHAGALRVSLHPSTSTFHPSVAHLHLHSLPEKAEDHMRELGMRLDHHTGASDGRFRPHDVIGSHIHASTWSIYNNDLSGGVSRSPFHRENEGWPTMWSTKHGSETDEQFKTKQAIGQGLRHIWSIPDISDSDRLHLHRHFESQLRHHYLAAVANPRMFDQHHRAVEDAQREQARQQGGQQSSGDSSRRRSGRPGGTWKHREQPHEILGVAADASPEDIKRAYRRLVVKHHPDRPGGDAELIKKINDANEHMTKKFDGWVQESVQIILEWVSKRRKK